jgi:hypothetical protein
LLTALGERHSPIGVSSVSVDKRSVVHGTNLPKTTTRRRRHRGRGGGQGANNQ